MSNRKLKPITYPFMSNDGNYTMILFGVDVIYQKYEILVCLSVLLVFISIHTQHFTMYEMGLR